MLGQEVVLELLEVVAMSVPATSDVVPADRSRVVDRYEPDIGFDQPTRQEAALAVGRSAVGVAGLWGFCERSKAFLTFGEASMVSARS